MKLKQRKKNFKSMCQKFLSRDLTALEHFPMRTVDLAVSRGVFVRGVERKRTERFADGVILRFFEIEKRVVKVKKYSFEHIFDISLSFCKTVCHNSFDLSRNFKLFLKSPVLFVVFMIY